MTEKTIPDWELIESLYRAGLLSVREIAAAQGVSHTAIQKKAKAGSWERDLKAKIKAKADALVAKAEVAKQVATERVATEQGIIEGNAQVVADIRMAHRKDISRSRRLAIKLLEELEGMTDERATLQELIAQLKEGEDADTAMLDLATKMMSLPNRTKIMKEIAEALRVLFALERQAYGIDDTTAEESYEDRLARLMGGKQ
ncbi:hypothetical protein [Pseudomonas syringae]|uniref:hypothetical protein n=1 Tax=Pseudomonas syringae TaxID=317 RepID=UPI001F0F273C|nr:hypothetical protein [Pseudomonas syringae]MCH5583126.1 hypothetical protein [Pseudomonas syringae pv. syringae]MCH5592775.1 hypothetical protein [Pseudomonas syringae pv. syringae]MDF5791026.1 hypothetical protein [Pseudomonas syringae pv. syringae]